MEDIYSHDNPNIVYISENIPGPKENSLQYHKLVEDFHSQVAIHCQCDTCIEPCNCITNSGGQNFERKKCVKIKSVNSEFYPIFECNDLCQCPNSCQNRLTQWGPIKHLTVKNCNRKGLGLFTTKQIELGIFICEYAGEIITKAQAIQRHELNKRSGSANYIFCLNEHSNGSVTQTVIDPSQFGNIGRYINHSCEPNSVILPVRVNSLIPKLAIFSCEDIGADSEITFDYGPHSVSLGSPNSALNKCYCYSQNCRKYLPFDVY